MIKFITLNIITITFIFLSSLYTVISLYEDQAGTFDWRKQYVGKVKELIYSDGNNIYLTTYENVLASLNKLNGEIVWRHIFEKDLNGELYGLILKNNYIIVTSGKEIVHCFNKNTGILIWESSIFSNSHKKFKSLLSDNRNMVTASNKALHILSTDNGILTQNSTFKDTYDDIFLYSSINGIIFLGLQYSSAVVVKTFDKKFDVFSNVLESKWITEDIGKTCDIIGKKLICFDKVNKMFLLDMDKPEKFEIITIDNNIDSIKKIPSTGLSIDLFTILSNNQLYVVSFESLKVKIWYNIQKIVSVETIMYLNENHLAVIQENNDQIDTLKLIVYEVTLDDLKIKHQLQIKNSYHPLRFFGKFWKNSAGITQYSIVLVGRDDSLRHISSQDEGWIREESLASISKIEFVDLPVTKVMADLEEEFNTEDNILGMAQKRFFSQIHQFLLFMERIKCKIEAYLFSQHKRSKSSANNEKLIDENYLFRDEFNIHKMIIAITSSGKLFGLDSNNGDVIWSKNLVEFDSYEEDIKDMLSLYIQRCTSHYPHQPIASLIAKNKKSRKTLVYSFDPITGQHLNFESKLTDNVISFSMLSLHDNQFIHPMILIDDKLKVSVYPPDSKLFVGSMISKIFLYVVDKNEGLINGYSLKSDMSAYLIWSVDVGKNSQVITKIAARRQTEKVHAVGIALEDRSVLYKYLNPNLLAVITEGEELQSKDSTQKIGGMFNVYLIDAISGSIVFHCIHKKSNVPIHLVHSENWIVYSYWSEKFRRTELSVVELYEGGEQYNASAFTSLHLPPHPVAIRQAYIFPGQISSAQVSISENGLTSKLLLFALENGAILGLPKILIDPRRPEVPSHESREEGLIPYMPELPRPTDHIINYHRSVFRVKSIYTYPTGLESTSLVLATGIDIFLTRVTPSKMFDVLKEDFDYFFISSVLIAMIIASFVSKQMASKKMITKLWK